MKMVFRLLEPLNWRNAVGHVLVTALGVVLALAAADWSEQRNRRAFELTLLQEMHTALVSDLTAIEQSLQRFQDIDGGLVQLLAVLGEKRPYDPAAIQGSWAPTFESAIAELGTLVAMLEVELKEAGVPLQQ